MRYFLSKSITSVKEKILLRPLFANQTTQTLAHADEAALVLSENTSFSLASLFHLLKKAVKKKSVAPSSESEDVHDDFQEYDDGVGYDRPNIFRSKAS